MEGKEIAIGSPVATAGIGYPGTQAHAPTENVRISDYFKGARHITRIIKDFAEKYEA